MKFKWLAVVVLIATAAALGWSYFHGTKTSQYQTAPVTVGEVRSSVAATGTCNAVVTVQVGSQVSGNIKALYADFNTKVTKGQLVALIDPELFQARVNQSRANLDSARAAVMNATAASVRAEAEIASAEAGRENVNAQLVRAQADQRD